MTTLTCGACGERYDPDREPAVAGASTDRCPACGSEDLAVGGDNPGGSTSETVSVDAENGATVRITIEVLPRGQP
jgi:NAD-dependent SIR2 family protein deacetylase